MRLFVWTASLVEAVRCIKVTVFCCIQTLFWKTLIGWPRHGWSWWGAQLCVTWLWNLPKCGTSTPLVAPSWQVSYRGKKKDVRSQPALSEFHTAEMGRRTMTVLDAARKGAAPNLGSGNLWDIFFLYRGQRNHAFWGLGPKVSAETLLFICVRHISVTQNGETKSSRKN